jgi:hypothetical protein
MWTRRRLLQTAALGAGASLFAPFMSRVWAKGPTTARVVIVLECNGIHPRSFASNAARAAIEAASGKSIGDAMNFQQLYTHSTPIVVPNDAMLTPRGSLAPLFDADPTKSLVTKAAVVLGLSSKIARGGHTSYQAGLSCANSDPFATAAITIDAHLAQRLKGLAPNMTPFDALRLGIGWTGQRLSYQTCAFGPGRPAPIVTNPVDAYNKTFGVIVGGGTGPVRERKMALDFAKEDVKIALGTFSGSSVERQKLERYLEALEVSDARQRGLIEKRAGSLGFAPKEPGPGTLYASDDPIDLLEAQFDIATASLLGGLTNVVVLASGPGGSNLEHVYKKVMARHFTGQEASMARHGLQHRFTDPKSQAAIMDVTGEHVRLVAKMARALDATPEGTGTMLDNTAIVLMSDNGERHHSESLEWPKLLVGGNGLGLKTDGRTVVYPGSGTANNRQVSNLFNTLGHATGDATLNAFGNEGTGRIALGPLSELYTPVV